MTQFKFFSIPVSGDEALEAELNRFLRSVRVVSKTVQLLSSNVHPSWAVCVEYFDLDESKFPEGSRGRRAKPSVDYREVLSEEDFVVFARLRDDYTTVVYRKARKERVSATVTMNF